MGFKDFVVEALGGITERRAADLAFEHSGALTALEWLLAQMPTDMAVRAHNRGRVRNWVRRVSQCGEALWHADCSEHFTDAQFARVLAADRIRLWEIKDALDALAGAKVG